MSGDGSGEAVFGTLQTAKRLGGSPEALGAGAVTASIGRSGAYSAGLGPRRHSNGTNVYPVPAAQLLLHESASGLVGLD